MTSEPVDADTAIILLGASNLTLGWPRLMSQLEAHVPGPRVVLTAHGMGRSYLASRSSFGARQLPGILQSSLWTTLDVTKSHNTPLVLITDLGNDLIYGRSPEEVVESASTCIVRIREWNPLARFVVTRPPVDSVNSLGPARFRFFRTIIFPKCQLTLSDAQNQTAELDERLAGLTETLDVQLATPRMEWFGLDPIHVRRRFQSEAFAAMMAGWNLDEPSHQSNVRHPRPLAHQRWVFGREKLTPQPVVTLGGSAVFAF